MIHDMNKPGGLYKSSSPFSQRYVSKFILKFLSYVFRKSFSQKPLVSELIVLRQNHFNASNIEKHKSKPNWGTNALEAFAQGVSANITTIKGKFSPTLTNSHKMQCLKEIDDR